MTTKDSLRHACDHTRYSGTSQGNTLIYLYDVIILCFAGVLHVSLTSLFYRLASYVEDLTAYTGENGR